MNEGNSEQQNDSEIQRLDDLKEFLTNLCESMCLDALETKPKDLPNYMINYLQNKYGYSSSGLQYEEKKELENLRNGVEIFRDMDEHTYYAELQKQVKKEIKVSEKKSKNPPKPKPRLPPDEIIISDDEDYDDADEIDQNLDNLDFIKNCNLHNKRIAVTENCVNDENDQGSIKTYKKSADLIEFMRINLMKSPIFSELPLDILRQCIDAMEEKNVPALTDVFKQGEIGDSFFFVEEGELECKMQFIKITREGNRKKVEKFEPKLVKMYVPGDYFGELSLLYHSPRRGTIKATVDSKLYVLNRNTYKKILKRANEEKIEKQINIFRRVPILEALTDEEFEKLEDISKEAVYNNGETIIKENEFSNVMFIIDKGKCIGTQTVEEGKIPVKTKDYKEGDIIGEAALLKGEKRQENIIANSDFVKLICLDRFSFKNNFGSLEQILMRNMDLYNIFFPPIQEEKPEEKNENKEENEKNQLLASQVPIINQHEQGKMNEINNQNQNNLNNNNNMNNNINVEELTKKIREEVEAEKKNMELKHEEEIEKLKKEIEFYKNQKEELNKIINENQIKNSNINNEEMNNEINTNVNNNEFNQNNNMYPPNQNEFTNNNNIDEQNQNQIKDDNNISKENNIGENNNEENINIENNNENNNNNEKDILKSNQTNLENQNEEASKNSSKLDLIRDILTYKEGDYTIKKENETIGQPLENELPSKNEIVSPTQIGNNNENNLINNEINSLNINANIQNKEEENEGFNEDNQINNGDFMES
jgi:cAMP-dependent protein kinase regulator